MTGDIQEGIKEHVRVANRYGYSPSKTVSSQLLEIANNDIGITRFYPK